MSKTTKETSRDWLWPLDSPTTAKGHPATLKNFYERGYGQGRIRAVQSAGRPTDYHEHHPAWRKGFDKGYEMGLRDLASLYGKERPA